MKNSQLNLSELRRKVNEDQRPYRVVGREQIQFVGRMGDELETKSQIDGYGNNVYKVDGIEVLATDYVSNRLDELIGLDTKQKRVIKSASGDAGVRYFRNYLASANSITKPTKLALVADPDSKTVTDVIPLKESLITSDSFFDFAEMFMERSQLTPTFHHDGFNMSSGITLFMDSDNPIVKQFAPGEDFLMNSFYLKWNLGQIELGRYYERLVCSNGQTETVRQSEAKIFSMETSGIMAMLNIPGNAEALNEAYSKFSKKALTAMETRASIAELGKVSKILSTYMVDSKSVREIAPFESEIERYNALGYDKDIYQMNQMKASMSFWELYNGVTSFASHTELWDGTDNRRSIIQGEIFSLLMKERDIKNYYDAFGD